MKTHFLIVSTIRVKIYCYCDVYDISR